MAEPGIYPGASLIPITADVFDYYRVYFDVPVSGGWRENRDPVSQRRYWSHVSLSLTTWSMVELVRMNGLEEFLLIGEWNLFVIVPESTEEYEDPNFTYNLFNNPELKGEPIRTLSRGAVVASTGMATPGIVELLVPDEGRGVMSAFGLFRFPPENGRRYLQRLPARIRNDDLRGMEAVTLPTWLVLPPLPGREGPEGRALRVTATRDPRSEELGWLWGGTPIGLNLVEGTRAFVGWIHGEDAYMQGGWISIVRMDGSHTIERVLEETPNMKMQAELARHLKELEAAGLDPAAARELAEQAMEAAAQEEAAGLVATKSGTGRRSSRSRQSSARRDGSARESSRGGSTRRSSADPSSARPTSRDGASSGEPLQPLEDYKPVELPAFAVGPPEVAEQRLTVVGGWRQILDPFWGRPQFFSPVCARATWGLNEVLLTGGLDDLLLNRSWELACIDPFAIELMKDDSWTLPVYGNANCSGDPIAFFEKGRIIVTQLYEPKTGVATVLVPSPTPGVETASGYIEYCMRDGRPLLRALVAPVEEPEELAKGSLRDAAEPPAGDLLEGPYIASPPGDAADIQVSVGQDLESDRWARLPRGYKVREFADILGFRARLPDLEGGGWVSICSPQGLPYFRRQPAKPPAVEEVEDLGTTRRSGATGDRKSAHTPRAHLPVVWPGKGVIWPELPPVPVPVPEPKQLPDLLHNLGQGRAVCDWERLVLPPYDEIVWKNRYCPSQTFLHDLLRLKIWKPAVVEAQWLHIREAEDERSRQLISLPRGSCIVTEWVSPSGAVRVLVPSKENDPRPIHGWSDLGGADGAAIVLLAEGLDFWIEPWGGHLPEEEQQDESPHDPMLVPLRASQDPDSEITGKLQRGDGVQIAELHGRRARLVQTKCMYRAEREFASGWFDIFCEAGWSRLKGRYTGDVHPEEARRKKYDDMEDLDFGEEEKVVVKTLVESSPDIEDEDEEAPAQLPELLKELGELETKSTSTRDWREAIDPVWGRRYYVNKWSGQVIHALVKFGVAQAGVKLTVFLGNMTVNAVELLRQDAPEYKLKVLEESALPGFSALADVPEDMVSVAFIEGPEEDPLKPGMVYKPPTSPLGRSETDSILGDSGGRMPSEEGFRVVVKLRAPGLKAAWASAGLRRAMSDAEAFTNKLTEIMSGVPQISLLLANESQPFTIIRADLEEMDIPRPALCAAPPPKKQEVVDASQIPDDEFIELRKNLMWSRPVELTYPFRQIGEVNTRALCEGLEMAIHAPHARLDPPHLQDLSLWCCSVGNGGAVALANAFSAGCGQKLQLLNLDDNDIGASGATALGAGLACCPLIRDVSISKNPLGKGFTALLSGLGSNLVTLDASDASCDDLGAAALAASLPRWPLLRILKMAGNMAIGLIGVECLVRSMVGAKALQQVDLRDANVPLATEFPRLTQLLQRGGVDPSRLRI
eukprot:TRINITY_DN27701_c0_g1_i1.p1 TRINITY_DN27701_c0_g1~~TRINITY_DN27701_c0_g1_i1.p1  ORF type:complete len:1436 (+),score=281.57 TRINITY_DN27701_c0_g1_i1:31-4338(+)